MNKQLLEETIELLQKLVQNKCVNPPGNEIKNIMTISDFLKSKGIDCKIFNSSPTKGNLIARIKGTGIGPSLMFGPSHVDVVPVEDPENWIIPPFSGEIKDDYVWGRGTFDMLFIVAAQCQAFAQLAIEDFKPKGDLVLAIVSDEETGSMFGAKWMIENHLEEMKVDYGTSEYGGFQISEGKLILSVGEKGASWLRLSFLGESGAASMPFGVENAAIKAAEAAVRLANYKTPVNTKYLKYMAQGMGLGFLQKKMLTKKILLPFAIKRLLKSDPSLAKAIHGFSRMTIAPTRIESGIKTNVIPMNSFVDLDVRTLPGQDFDYIKYHIKKALGKDLAKEVKLEIMEEEGIMTMGNESSIDSDFVKAALKVFQKLMPGCAIVPAIAYGATDLRFIREIGGMGYGFSFYSPKTPVSELTSIAHATNERIRIESIELTFKAYYELAKELLG
ncbi:MAG: M20/M25/M40 family metallo-hydrolase [Candidatus Heimdallarchaeota archaeon]|nr:M20/M25/M40 family metallo-hydrolase [Candidatus Heimdallarchaeota archaeon]